MTNDNQDQRESMREVQLGILKDDSVKNLFIASVGNEGEYGPKGKDSTQMNYISALENPSSHIAGLLTNPFLKSAKDAMSKGENIYEGAGVTPIQLLKSAYPYYLSAIDKVKVSDILNLMQIENVHGAHISADQKNMYMEDFKEVNKDMYSTLFGTYMDTTAKDGVGKSLINSGIMERKGLENLLSQDPNAEK